jgi:transcriptional regulator with XRE-family HTH domain
MPSASAADLFGGKDRVSAKLVAAICQAMEEKAITPSELGEAADLDPSIVSRILAGTDELNEDIALRLMAVLGIALEDALPALRPLTAEERLEWKRRILSEKGDGPVAS